MISLRCRLSEMTIRCLMDAACLSFCPSVTWVWNCDSCFALFDTSVVGMSGLSWNGHTLEIVWRQQLFLFSFFVQNLAIPGDAFTQISGEYELQSSANSTLSLKLDMKVCT